MCFGWHVYIIKKRINSNIYLLLNSAAEWNDPVSKNCYGEKLPVLGFNYSGIYPDQMKVLNGVIKAMKHSAYFLDITRLSELRKDAHPSVYSGVLSPHQRANPDRSADCSHWCLPGLPDTWNQLFYNALFFWIFFFLVVQFRR